jgi:hypothetical protein
MFRAAPMVGAVTESGQRAGPQQRTRRWIGRVNVCRNSIYETMRQSGKCPEEPRSAADGGWFSAESAAQRVSQAMFDENNVLTHPFFFPVSLFAGCINLLQSLRRIAEAGADRENPNSRNFGHVSFSKFAL